MDQLNENKAVQSEPSSFEPIQKSPEKKENPVVGFWQYLGMIVLFSIPVIGFIAALVFVFAFKNKNVKNFAGAQLTFVIAQAVISFLAVVLLVTSIFGLILPVINQTLGTNFENLSQIIAFADELEAGNKSVVLKSFTPALVGVFGEEYEGFFKELSSGKYEDFLRALENEQYSAALSDLKDGKYPDLTNTLDPDSYNFIISELEKEANGMDSDFFESIEEIF